VLPPLQQSELVTCCPVFLDKACNNTIGHQSCMLNYTAHFCSPTFHLASVFCNFLFPLLPLIFPWSYSRGKGLTLYDLLVSLSTKTIFVLPKACPVCPNIKYQSLNRVSDKCAPLIYVFCPPSLSLMKYCAVMEPINNASDLYWNQILMQKRIARAAIHQVVLRVMQRQGSVFVHLSSHKSHAL
jgi:hypothetical protein